MERLFENLPVQINLSDQPRVPASFIGFAHAHRTDDGETHIHITLHTEASEKLGNLVDAFKLSALGFAGVRRKAKPMPEIRHFTVSQTREVKISASSPIEAAGLADKVFTGETTTSTPGDTTKVETPIRDRDLSVREDY